MKKYFSTLSISLALLIGLSVTSPSQISAQTVSQGIVDLVVEESSDSADSTASAQATDSAKLASPSAEVEQKIQEKKEQDITEDTGKQKSKLAAYLEENPPGPLSWNNFLQHSIRYAVTEGVPANIIVLILLFPLVASMIAGSRHIIGLKGFGIYIPAVLSVALVSTGVFEGLAIFIAIAAASILSKKLIMKMKLPYLPRTALIIWTISLGIFGVLMLAPILNLTTLMSVNIFPILILVLLSENFLDAQSRTKQSAALALTLETLGLAVVAGFFLKWEPLQRLALTEPELLILTTALLNVFIGKFVGLRITERLRFRALIEEE